MLDMTLLPIVWVLDMANYLDRNNIAYENFPGPFHCLRQLPDYVNGLDRRSWAALKRTLA